MDLRHLRYFVCVAEEMHFGRAAQRLGISQPPLSQQIRALEDELGVQLFERTSRRVRLTEVGQLFEPEARQTLLQAERAGRIARYAQRGEVGTLALGVTASGPFVPQIADTLYDFRQRYPDVELTLRELGRDEQIEAVRDRRLDLGIVRDFDTPALPPAMTSRCLSTEDMVLALRNDHPLARRASTLAIDDLVDEPLVLYGGANGAGFNEHFVALCARRGFAPRVAHEALSLATLLGLVAAGFGPTIVARSMTRLQLDAVVTRDFDETLTSSLWLIHNDELPTIAQNFMTMLLER